MQSHTLHRAHPNKTHRTVGRGGKHAKTSGRGTKGQNARAGHKKRPEIRDFIKRIPKLRGRGKNSNISAWSKPFVVNLGKISKLFKDGDTVNPRALAAHDAFNAVKGTSTLHVKILATGTLDKKLTFVGCMMSESAQAMIEKAGGTVEK